MTVYNAGLISGCFDGLRNQKYQPIITSPCPTAVEPGEVIPHRKRC